jgi:hypothetical protein
MKVKVTSYSPGVMGYGGLLIPPGDSEVDLAVWQVAMARTRLGKDARPAGPPGTHPTCRLRYTMPEEAPEPAPEPPKAVPATMPAPAPAPAPEPAPEPPKAAPASMAETELTLESSEAPVAPSTSSRRARRKKKKSPS